MATTRHAGRVDTVFMAGDRVLRTKELLDAADISMLRPRRDSPSTVTYCPSPNAHSLVVPRKMRRSSTVNDELTANPCVNPFFARPGRHRLPGWYLKRGRRASTRWSCSAAAALSARRATRRRRRVAEVGGAGALPGEGCALPGEVRRRGPTPPRRPPSRGPTRRRRLLQPLPRQRRHHLWRPPSFGSWLRPRS